MGAFCLALVALFAQSLASRVQQGGREDRVLNPVLGQTTKALGRWTHLAKLAKPSRFKAFKPSAKGPLMRRSPFAMKYSTRPGLPQFGKHRYSTRVGLFGKSPARRVNLPTWTWSRMHLSTERAHYFGKVLKDQLAKKEIQAARVLRQNKDVSRCSPSQVKEFTDRFNYNKGSTALAYKHPSSEMTAVYIVTSAAGDHNGAFSGLNRGGDRGWFNMCYRLLQMSAHYNVVYRQVDSVQQATEFVEDVKKNKDFGKALKHVTISGHGSPTTLVLGQERLLQGELRAGNAESTTEKFFQALKPALIHTGDARSTVFLDSCSTGKETSHGDPLAKCVAETLPGVQVHAFDNLMYPKTIALRPSFIDDAQFGATSMASQGGTFSSTTFMAKEPAEGPEYTPEYALLQRSNATETRSEGDEDEEDFEFYDGLSLMSTIEMCADWCALVVDCSSFEFTEPDEAQTLSVFGRCVLRSQQEEPVETQEPAFGYVGGEVEGNRDAALDGLQDMKLDWRGLGRVFLGAFGLWL